MKTAILALAFLTASLVLSPANADDTPAANGPRIAVPVHDIERGEVITDADLSVVTVPPDRMRPGVVMTVADISGREARRLLRAGELVRTQDIRMPVLVAKGSTVTMTFDLPGIALTATGQAMSEGGMGEMVVVQNPVSFRQVSCIVTGPGQVRAGDVASTVNP